MSGIAGMTGPKPVSEKRLQAALTALSHRGPDGESVYQSSVGPNFVVLLQKQLNVTAPYPPSNQTENFADASVVFDGQIYNRPEIKAELELLGHKFIFGNDAEILLHAWREWDCSALDRMEGMWAFALFDERKGKIYLCRDRFGEKPLITARAGENFYFASEPGALAALMGCSLKPDLRHINRVLVQGFRSHFMARETYFEGVKNLSAATLAVIDQDSRETKKIYWPWNFQPQAMKREEAAEGLRERIIESLRLRLRVNKPCAFCLSGGIDSTTTAGIAARHFNMNIKTFSIIDSDPRYDESEFIDAAAVYWGVENRRHRISKGDFIKRVRRLTLHRHEPVLTLTALIHSYISDAMADEGVKVAFGGIGGDGLFTGSFDQYNLWLADRRSAPNYKTLLEDWRRSYGAFVRNPFLKDPEVFVKNPDMHSYLNSGAEKLAEFMKEPDTFKEQDKKYCSNVLRNRMINDMAHEVMPVSLHDEEFNFAMLSIENRSPYLDRRLVEFMLTVPNEHLVHDGYPKWPLRAAGEGFVPDKVRLNREKRGFNASLDSMIDRSSDEARSFFLDDGPIFDLVRRSAVEDLLNAETLSDEHRKFLFGVATARIFLDAYSSETGITKNAP